VYQVLGALLLRASTQPADLDLPPWPDLTGDVRLDLVREWLNAVWSHEPSAHAIAVASPDLARQVERIRAGQQLDPRQLRRTVAAVGRYLLRFTGRCAPFGVFAGVAPVTVGATPAVRWGHCHQAVTRPDGTWLAGIISALEACPPLLRRLTVRLNDLTDVRADRVILPYQPCPDRPRRRDAPATVDVSVRLTTAVAAVITRTRTPITVADLLGKLACEFPRAAPRAAEDAVITLVRLRILLTALRPSMVTTDGLAHLLAELTASRADDLPEIAETVRELRIIAACMGAGPSPAPAGQRVAHLALSTRMTRLHNPGGQPVTVDLRLDTDIVLPASLAREAAAAATALTRLTPYPHGLPAWREYHAAFLERYGIGAVVPLLDLVDPGIGLGYPATYRGSERSVAAAGLSERDRGLLRLAQQATMGGGDELVLDDRAIADLAGPDGAACLVPPHIELFLQVDADSVSALGQEQYTLAVTGASRAAGATTGRFLYLLETGQQDLFRTAYASVATLRAQAVPAQVSIPPIRDSSNSLACAPRMLPAVLSAGEFVADGDPIRAQDLAVGGDADGLFLVSLRDRRLIEPTVLNAVEFRYFSHPLTRLLCELPRACTAVYMPFSWGAAASQPFLPQVRYRRTILAPARWNLAGADLPPADASWPQWRDALAAWRTRFRAPERTYLVEADNLLPLDLGNDRHQQLLRTHLDRHGHARLGKAPRPGAFGWLKGHAHEITIPLTSTMSPHPDRLPARVRPVNRDDAHLPGSAHWLYAKLYTSKDHVVGLAHQVPELTAEAEDFREWWYLPYGDPEPHLRLRIRLPAPDAYGRAAARVSQWAGRLRASRLISRLQLDTYTPETGRYGHGDAMTAAEAVFAADSAAALGELRAAAGSGVPLDALTAASFVNTVAVFTGDTATAMTWIVAQLPNEAAPPARPTYLAAVRLSDPDADWSALRAADTTGAVLGAWQRRRSALVAYRDQLTAQRDPISVLPSLLHLHSIRVHGVDPHRERAAGRLARAAALRWSALHPVSSR